MRKLFRQLHLWLSVPFGVVVTLVCFSGAMLVFEDEVVRLSHRELFHTEPVGRPVVTLDEVARRVAATLPEGTRVTGVTVEADPGRTWRVNLSRPKHAWAAVNPYTGEVVGRYERPPFFTAMFRLHRWLLDSRPSGDGVFWGKQLVGVSTLLFVVALLTGVPLWWPRTRRALRRGLSFAPLAGLALFLARPARGRGHVCLGFPPADGPDGVDVVVPLVSFGFLFRPRCRGVAGWGTRPGAVGR